jgi:hypothetical protein
MKVSAPLSVVLFVANAFAQAPSKPQPTVEKFCGKLYRIHYVPIRDKIPSYSIKTNDLRHVTVRLYAATENGKCCDGLSPIATTTTGHWGSFGFTSKGLPGGLYWLQAEPQGNKYSILVRYTPKRHADQLCYQTSWAIDDAGHFSEGWGIVTVD